MKIRRGLMLFLALLSLSASAREFEVWSTFNLNEGKIGPVATTTHTHFRFQDDGYLRYFRVSQKFSYALDEIWTVGLHPVLERSRSRTSGGWSDTGRLDFELNPRFTVGAATVSVRNRFEVRVREGGGSRTYNRFRSNWVVNWKASWLPGMTTIGMANEIFYDFAADRWNANWFAPIVLGFSWHEDFRASVGYQITSSYRPTTDNWRHSNVLLLNGTYRF